MPSIETLVASVVRQLRTTWSPAEITAGVAVICAVGAAEATGGGASGAGNGLLFLPQPATAVNAMSSAARTKIECCRFNGMLLPRVEKLRLPKGLTLLPRLPGGPLRMRSVQLRQRVPAKKATVAVAADFRFILSENLMFENAAATFQSAK
jgi:hypothetical protein